jgi:hypothetical protein
VLVELTAPGTVQLNQQPCVNQVLPPDQAELHQPWRCRPDLRQPNLPPSFNADLSSAEPSRRGDGYDIGRKHHEGESMAKARLHRRYTPQLEQLDQLRPLSFYADRAELQVNALHVFPDDDGHGIAISFLTAHGSVNVLLPPELAAARRFRDVLSQIIADLSGPEGLSEGQRQLARRVATIAIACEKLEGDAAAGDAVDLVLYGMLVDRMGRCFDRLGLKRQQRDVTPSVAAYLREAAE